MKFKNHTGSVQQINTINEGFNVEPEQTIEIDVGDIPGHEMERLKNFFSFESEETEEPRNKRRPRPTPEPQNEGE